MQMETSETEPKKKMGSQMKTPNKQFHLNPNWSQLLQKLKSSNGSKPSSKPSQKSETQTQLQTLLGKRKERPHAESNDSRPNPLVPTSCDFSVTDAIAMDCEMVGVSSLGNKSALGRVTLVNKWGNVIYDEYVCPADRVVDFRTEISGIRPRDLKKAKDFCFVQKKVTELIQGRILVGHALRYDLKGIAIKLSKEASTRYGRVSTFSEGRMQ